MRAEDVQLQLIINSLKFSCMDLFTQQSVRLPSNSPSVLSVVLWSKKINRI
ncbi:hypothetical protein KFK09_006051 [Dendrobium nobile]|uniref:Uncharacterized protein n=1 Tax=Dendrobium nobile TaxID=94219 RepID=A0A8T3BMT6_DENNO|nr:hypothetical protein KFK09_006051 [Dendrobium nobile]